jgi:SAM-dependent methyltransferase
VYGEDYYAGRGADPLVDYHFELAEPERTIRRYEWAGIVEVVGSLTQLHKQTRWLDFGCGNGGLVRYVRAQVGCEVVGFEEGGIVPAVRAAGVPVVDRAELAAAENSFDIVTAIEVLEHVVDPLETLQCVRKLLRPGGLFFYTTGNARPQRQRLLKWSYFRPEIHISLFDPGNMEEALRKTGFEPSYPGYLPGWDRIIAFKMLKNLRVRRTSPLYRMMPWRLLAPLVNQRYGVYDFPVGWAS